MAIPHRELIKKELIKLLASRSEGMKTSNIYVELAKVFPGLTLSECTERYRNSASKWANTVQFVRADLVDQGIIFRPGNDIPNGIWKLIPHGINNYSRVIGIKSIDVPANPEVIKTYTEEERVERISKIIERSSKAREICLSHYGYACMCCNTAVKDKYRNIQCHIIEVHHIKEISLIQNVYSVNPIDDLVPLCPNCHRAIHTVRPCYEINEFFDMYIG